MLRSVAWWLATEVRDKQPTNLNCLTLEEGADSPEISVTKHQRMRKIFNLKIKFYMVLRKALESFSSHEMLRTALVQCQVEITGTRQVTACFKVHFLNSLGETNPPEKNQNRSDIEFPVLLTLLPSPVFILVWGVIQHTDNYTSFFLITSYTTTKTHSSNSDHTTLTCTVRQALLTFRHRASCILGQAFRYSPENAFYIFNQQIYFII